MEDRFGHRISYLRVSITDRCNERCTYCMPQELQEWLPRHDILTFEENIRLIRIASELGVTKLRLTGGEPLTRRDVIQLFRELPRLTNLREIGLSTNGTLLTREVQPGPTMAAAVRACGFNSINISLDTLDRAEYARVTGRDLLPQVIAGIDAANQQVLCIPMIETREAVERIDDPLMIARLVADDPLFTIERVLRKMFEQDFRDQILRQNIHLELDVVRRLPAPVPWQRAARKGDGAAARPRPGEVERTERGLHPRCRLARSLTQVHDGVRNLTGCDCAASTRRRL